MNSDRASSATFSDRPREWLLHYFQYLEGQVTFADTKAGHLLTANSILLAGLGLVFDQLKLGSASATVALAAAGALVVSISVSLVAIAPARMHFARNPPPLNHFQFSAVARHYGKADSSSYIAAIRLLSEEQVDEEWLLVIFGKSRFAYWKFRWLFRGVWSSLAGVLLAVAAAVLYGSGL